MWKIVQRVGRQLFGQAPGLEAATPQPDGWRPYDLAPMRRRVVMVIHNPLIELAGGQKLSQLMGWYDPDALAAQYAADLAEASGGFAQYELVERIEVDGYPVKKDGFAYDDETYMHCWRQGGGWHQPDAIDYERLLARFDILAKAESGFLDEAWFFAFPYAGDYESTMVGQGAFWCNSPPVPNTASCRRRFVVMAFNYEREVGCMLENFGHRVESIMSQVFARHPPAHNLWQRFTRYDKSFPGGAECGNVHFAPNSERDYDWGNRRMVLSSCDDWFNFPALRGERRPVNCSAWGGGDMRLHHLWWLRHLPKVAGETYGVDNNWWRYVLDPQLVSI